jgi:hypothetical protein
MTAMVTDTTLQDIVNRLDGAARSASAAEETCRHEAAERIRGLELARIYAFRRLNLVKSIASAMSGAKNQEEAMAWATSAFLREVNWTGASESQREVIERFQPMIDALWRLQQGEPETNEGEFERKLAAFETWFAENRNGTFLSLMDGEVLELPLVEV